MAYMTIGEANRMRTGRVGGLGADAGVVATGDAFLGTVDKRYLDALRSTGQAAVQLNALAAGVKNYVDKSTIEDLLNQAYGHTFTYKGESDPYWVKQLWKLKQGNEEIAYNFTRLAEDLVGKKVSSWGNVVGTMDFTARAARAYLDAQWQKINKGLGFVWVNAKPPNLDEFNAFWQDVKDGWNNYVEANSFVQNMAGGLQAGAEAFKNTLEAGADASKALADAAAVMKKFIANAPTPAKVGIGVGLAIIATLAVGAYLFSGKGR